MGPAKQQATMVGRALSRSNRRGPGGWRERGQAEVRRSIQEVVGLVLDNTTSGRLARGGKVGMVKKGIPPKSRLKVQ
jgi:hypothetical protein